MLDLGVTHWGGLLHCLTSPQAGCTAAACSRNLCVHTTLLSCHIRRLDVARVGGGSMQRVRLPKAGLCRYGGSVVFSLGLVLHTAMDRCLASPRAAFTAAAGFESLHLCSSLVPHWTY